MQMAVQSIEKHDQTQRGVGCYNGMWKQKPQVKSWFLQQSLNNRGNAGSDLKIIWIQHAKQCTSSKGFFPYSQALCFVNVCWLCKQLVQATEGKNPTCALTCDLLIRSGFFISSPTDVGLFQLISIQQQRYRPRLNTAADRRPWNDLWAALFMA